VTFSSADYPLFLIAVFAIYALTRIDAPAGRLARVVVLVLLGDLVYLLLAKDVGALWDPIGGLAYAAIAKETALAPLWHLPLGAAVLAAALWTGWRHGDRLSGRRAQVAIAWTALAALAAMGIAIGVTWRAGVLDEMSRGFQACGHLLFLAVLGVAIGAAQTAGGRGFGRVLVLMLASSIFYHAWAAAQVGAYRYLLLLLLAIVVGDFLLGLAIDRSEDPRLRKALLIVSLASNLGVLALFKYYDFFTIGVLGLDVAPLHLILPAGISFHTFQSLSYTIDVYRRQIPATRSVVQFATFVLFFPQLVAGPIVRAHELLPQMDRLPRLDRQLAADGLFRIVVGLFKKVALADLLAALIVDRVFESPGRFSGLEVAIGVCGYAFQIYLDFSAYSDIAIGSAQLLGFRFPENFATPYRSANLQEFWRRWHITLSSWLRDYLYKPLGGSRGGSLLTYRNLIVTMLLGGLWHGANWTFIIWGALHGFGLAMTRVFQRRAEANQPLGTWRFGALGLAVMGTSLHLLVLAPQDPGVLVHLIVAWLYVAPLWAAATVWLTHTPEPRVERVVAAPPAPPPRSAPPRSAIIRKPKPAPRKRRSNHKARKKKRRQRGSVRIARAVALEPSLVRALRAIAVVIGGGAVAWFVAWSAAPVYAFRALLDPQAVTAVPPPGGVLPLAIACWAVALVADGVERRPERALVVRWSLWALRRGAAVVLTFAYVCLAWIFFRAPTFDDAVRVLAQMATLSTDTGSLLPQVKIVLGVALLAHFFAPSTFRWARDTFPRLPAWAQATLLVAAALALRVLASAEAAPFIYFQF